MKWNIYLLRVKWVVINSRDVQWTMVLKDEEKDEEKEDPQMKAKWFNLPLVAGCSRGQ